MTPATNGASLPPTFVVIGHATRDLMPDGGWRLGGTVTFAALTAQRLGWLAGIVTSGPEDLLAALTETLPGVAIAAIPAQEATTFENRYTDRRRLQYLRGRAAPLTLDAVPLAWRAAPLVLLAPLAQEVAPAMAAGFPASLVAATPQGWLRRWAADGFVVPCPLGHAARALPHLGALILSREDVLAVPDASGGDDLLPTSAAEADARIAAWARLVPLVVVTAGADGAQLLRDGEPPRHFPASPVREVDPTGAGDVFAAAFLCHLRATGDPAAAVAYANQVAGLSIEREGTAGIPTREEIQAQFGAS
ncbi:MAG: ribokinase [Ktedonobacterales bacterium]|nr:ribokinase [Ktedonobacterales bacterium]